MSGSGTAVRSRGRERRLLGSQEAIDSSPRLTMPTARAAVNPDNPIDDDLMSEDVIADHLGSLVTVSAHPGERRGCITGSEYGVMR